MDAADRTSSSTMMWSCHCQKQQALCGGGSMVVVCFRSPMHANAPSRTALGIFSENSHKGIVGNIADLNGRLSLRADRAGRISENLTKFGIMLAGNFPIFLAPFLERRRRRTIFNERDNARVTVSFSTMVESKPQAARIEAGHQLRPNPTAKRPNKEDGGSSLKESLRVHPAHSIN